MLNLICRFCTKYKTIILRDSKKKRSPRVNNIIFHFFFAVVQNTVKCSINKNHQIIQYFANYA